jgi:hypothetical protein
MPLTINKTIRPNAIWQEMYLRVQSDQRLVISAEGIWSPEMRPATIVWCSANGIEGNLAGDDYLLPGTNVGALICRVGSDNPPLVAGVYFDFFSPYQGPLYMAMNENPEYQNQAGSIQAQIILFEP